MVAIIVFVVFIAGLVWLFSNTEAAAGCGIGIVLVVLAAIGFWAWGWGWSWYQSTTMPNVVRLTQVVAASPTHPDSETSAPSSRVIEISGYADNNDSKRAVSRLLLELVIRHCALNDRAQPNDCSSPTETRFLSLTSSEVVKDDPNIQISSLIEPGSRSQFKDTLLVTNVPSGKAAIATVSISRACTGQNETWCDEK